jgi:hypothetical protein
LCSSVYGNGVVRRKRFESQLISGVGLESKLSSHGDGWRMSERRRCVSFLIFAIAVNWTTSSAETISRVTLVRCKVALVCVHRFVLFSKFNFDVKLIVENKFAVHLFDSVLRVFRFRILDIRKPSAVTRLVIPYYVN